MSHPNKHIREAIKYTAAWERGGDLKKHRPEHIIMECCIVQKHRGRAITKQFTQRPVIRWDTLDAFAKLWIAASTN